jgi:hypothetical protein
MRDTGTWKAGARRAAAGVAGTAAAALVLQYALLLRVAPDGALLATVRFFSYFTILGNLLVAAACAAVAGGRGPAWLVRPRALAGVALYIAIVGIVYVLVLRPLWQPQGAQWVADAALHYVVPVAYLGWWTWALPHRQLAWRDLAWWLPFPLAYLGWALWRGSWSGEYPYPFLDVAVLGTGAVVRNALAVTAGFLALGALLVVSDRHWPGPRRNR